jgi:aspartate oxidase
MKRLIPVEGMSNLYRDSESQAVVNTNRNEYNSYMSRKKALVKKNNELDQMKEDLDGMKDEMSEIKSLLVSLNQKLNT